MNVCRALLTWTLLLSSALTQTALSQTASPYVKVTPLGSHTGELCALDRALVFEDPDGTRILFDAGRTVRGPADPRLGHIDAVLLSHAHADHLGDAIAQAQNAGSCGGPEFAQKLVPGSNTVNIVVAQKARLIVGAEMTKFFAARVREAGGQSAQVSLLRFGGTTQVGGVTVISVTAAHSNGLDPMFLTGELAQSLEAAGLTADLGPAGGYVLRFSNGLVAYLSGDTGVIADQSLVVRELYKAQLMVLNIGGTYTAGPLEAAYITNELVRPTSVIASHVNEAATLSGQVRPGSKTDQFIKLSHVPVVLPLSGQVLEFNATGVCVRGC